MGEVHQLVFAYGRQGALDRADSAKQRMLINMAADLMEQDRDAIGLTYSGFCITALPHKRLPDSQHWIRHANFFQMVIQPGLLKVGRDYRLFGVPYGSRARMILIYLQTQAVRNQSREVKLGRSMNQWLAKMGIPIGGTGYRDVREQANRISACHLRFDWQAPDGSERYESDHIIKSGIRLHASEDHQGRLWDETVLLADAFFEALMRHPVPISETALGLINNDSPAIDIYIWLSYRLRSLVRPTMVSWPSLHLQFGAGYKAIRQFKPRFIDSLQRALAVYPYASVDLLDKGVKLYPSQPPVDTRIFPMSTGPCREPNTTDDVVASRWGLPGQRSPS